MGTSLFSVLVGLVLLITGVCLMLFFRDPERKTKCVETDILSPADGRVVEISFLESHPCFDGPCIRVSIFLSVFDVHMNRAPFSGKVIRIDYLPGAFLDARSPETSERNESLNLLMQTSYGCLAVRQIAGKIARRIVCRVMPGESLERGEKYGMIRFGSRTELYMPQSVQVCVELHQRVAAGHTLIARFS